MAQRGLARNMRVAIGLGAALAMAGCGDQNTGYPALMPTDQLLAEPALPAHARDAARSVDETAGSLTAQRDALHGRADRAVSMGGQTGDLAARATALRARAKALAATSVSGDVAMGCPDGQSDCPAVPATYPAQ